MEKLAVANERLDYAVELDNGIVAVLSRHRLFTCRKDNVREVLGTYWRPTRTTGVPASYGNCLYLVKQRGGALEVFTVSGEGRISKTAVLNKGSHRRVAAIHDGKLYDVARDDNAWDPILFVYSLANPSAPSLLSSAAVPGMKSIASAFHLARKRLHCVNQGKLWAFDMDETGEVGLLGQVAFDTNGTTTGGLMVDGTHAYIHTGRGFGTIGTFDVSRPTDMKELLGQEVEHSSKSFGNKKGFFSVSNDGLSEFVYAPDRSKGLIVGKAQSDESSSFVAGPEGGFVVGRDGSLTERPFGAPRPKNRGLGAGGHMPTLVAANDHLYALAYGLRVFDIRDPRQIKQVAWEADMVCSSSPFRVGLRKGLIYTNVMVIDVREPARPKVVEKYRGCSGLSIYGSIMYRLRGKNYLAARIRDGKPMEQLHAGILDGEGEPRHLLVTGRHVFIAFDRKRVACYTIRKDYSLAPLSSFELPRKDSYTGAMRVEGNMLYIAMGRAGTACFGISDPGKPMLYSWLDTSQSSREVFVMGGKVFTAEGSGGILAIDMRERGQPAVLSRYPTCDSTSGLAVYKGHIYSAERNAGIGVFRCPDLQADEPGAAVSLGAQQLSTKDSAVIDAVINVLGATSHRARKDAQKKLEAMLPDEVLREHLRHRLQDEKDPEIQARLRELVE